LNRALPYWGLIKGLIGENKTVFAGGTRLFQRVALKKLADVELVGKEWWADYQRKEDEICEVIASQAS
jgi:hypothetical protein